MMEDSVMNLVKAYAVYGFVNNEKEEWIKRIENFNKICEILGIKANRCSVFSAKDNNIQSLRGLENKIGKLYQKGDVVDGMEFYLLPENFTTIIFDFAVTISCNGGSEGYCAVMLNTKYSNYYSSHINENELIKVLKENIEPRSGEIFEMDIKECPGSYIFRHESDYEYMDEDFTSLNIIREI